ncbi:MAG: nucleotide sugar dehydrogenase [Clostridia bacterium]|nr:nucleotide sugar dehydrogenase [Clostridia bacterium]MDD4386502.1 nucleotide sugar dehydrogenase [Clostridia bacterium]
MNNNIYSKIIAVVGLGYVGLPLANSFSKKYKVIGFDINEEKVNKYINGIDVTNEIGYEELKKSSIEFTCNPQDIKRADIVIIAVPTPIDSHKKPDLTPVIKSSETVGKNLKEGTIVIYESTVYPGLTEEICVPILEKESGLKCGIDFKVAYSPERINPGDKVHRFETITKIVSGMDEETLNIVADLYSSVVTAGVYRASSIKVAEAAKVIENSQRDINIAFVNELAIIFNKMGIDTNEVLDAAGSKWNFLNFRPGLVGGHCIGVDPFYLTYKAQELGYNSKVILSGRNINDNMGKFIAETIVKKLIKKGIAIKGAKVLILGLTFKENVGDLRNSKVMDIIKELQEYEIKVYSKDPYINIEEIKHEYGIEIDENKNSELVDAIILTVAHDEYKLLTAEQLKNMTNGSNLLFDVKATLDNKNMIKEGVDYWRL